PARETIGQTDRSFKISRPCATAAIPIICATAPLGPFWPAWAKRPDRGYGSFFPRHPKFVGSAPLIIRQGPSSFGCPLGGIGPQSSVLFPPRFQDRPMGSFCRKWPSYRLGRLWPSGR